MREWTTKELWDEQIRAKSMGRYVNHWNDVSLMPEVTKRMAAHEENRAQHRQLLERAGVVIGVTTELDAKLAYILTYLVNKDDLERASHSVVTLALSQKIELLGVLLPNWKEAKTFRKCLTTRATFRNTLAHGQLMREELLPDKSFKDGTWYRTWRLNGKHEIKDEDTSLEHMEDAERRCVVLGWCLDRLMDTIVKERGTVPDGFTFQQAYEEHAPFLAQGDHVWFRSLLEEMLPPPVS